MPPHISVRDINFTPSTEGVRIIVITDIPCHLFCRLTTEKPLIHKKAVIIRGLAMQDDVRFCFTVFEDNEQFETGDTLIHTFWKTAWQPCATKWLYLWGYVAGIISPSTSAIFKYHNTGEAPVPVPDILYTFNPIDPENLVVNVLNAWDTFDLTDYINPDATGVILYWGFWQNVGITRFNIRKNGQTFNVSGETTTPCQGCAIVGVDSEKKIQIYTSQTLDLHVYIIGYTGRNVHFFDEPIDISPILNQTWTTQDLSAQAPGANAIIGEQSNRDAARAFRSDVRNNGSTDNYLYGSEHNWWTMGCDTNQKLQTWVWTAGPLMKHYALGYIVGNSSFYTDRIPFADPPAGAWTLRTVKHDLAVPIYGIVHYGDLSTLCDYGIKKRWGYFNPTIEGRGQEYWPIHCMPSGAIEIFRANVNGHFYLVGETE